MKTINAARANREFSKLLAGVQQGEHFIVVSRGTPVATMGPATGHSAQRHAALEVLLARLRAQVPKPRRGRKTAADSRGWTRDDLYPERFKG
jgi:antitoxin (DNA-binding transcriptional repressor) of toxin-antitoxin stability system